MINLIKYILLGIIQGITEPLPISSSGHLIIFKQIFNASVLNDLSFEIFLNFASFLAMFIIFWNDIKELLSSFFIYIFKKDKKHFKNFKYCMMVIVGCIPVGIAGLLFKDIIETNLSNTWIVSIAFIITGIMLLIVKNNDGIKKDYDITYKDAILIGLFQALAVIPGLSRSGMCLVGCLLCGLNKKSSLKYTFILYFPVSIPTMGLEIFELSKTGISTSLLFYYLIAMMFSFIFTYIFYKILSDIVNKGRLWIFSIYLFIAGVVTLLLFI